MPLATTRQVSIKQNVNTHMGHFGEVASWQVRRNGPYYHTLSHTILTQHLRIVKAYKALRRRKVTSSSPPADARRRCLAAAP